MGFGLAYRNRIFLATCMDSGQKRVLSGGADGTSWSELSSAAYDNLIFANGYFYSHKLVGGAGEWDKSTDGFSWTAAGFTSAYPFTSHSNDIMKSWISYGNGVYIQVFYVILSSASVYRNTDGLNWSVINIASTCPTGVAYKNGFSWSKRSLTKSISRFAHEDRTANERNEHFGSG